MSAINGKGRDSTRFTSWGLRSKYRGRMNVGGILLRKDIHNGGRLSRVITWFDWIFTEARRRVMIIQTEQ